MRLARTACLTALLGLPVAHTLAADGPVIPADIKASVRLRIEADFNVGIVVGLVNHDGEAYYSYGKTSVDSDTDLDADSVFEIGSITKAFTGTLLADMVTHEQVKLTDPISKLLPKSVKAPAFEGKPITLEDLATQSSALPRMPSNLNAKDFRNPFASYTEKQLYEFLSGYKLTRAPGEKYLYSNYGFGLLGHLLARRAGSDYEHLIRERITAVVGMPNTGITLSKSMRAHLAKGHNGTVPVPNWDIPTLAGAGALRSTARDMLTFLAANMGIEESPLKSAFELARRPRRSAGSPAMKIGLGWHVLTRDGRQVVWHNGGTGGYRTFAGFLADGSLGAVVLSNSNRSVDDLGIKLLDPT